MSPVDKGPVANTDQEIMAAAFTDEEQDFDDTDRTLEEMGSGPEGQRTEDDEADDEPPVAAAEEQPKPAGDDKGKTPEPEPEPEPELPHDAEGLRAAMVAERRARQAAEAAGRTAAEQARAELAAANARIDRLLAQGSTQQQPPPQQQLPPKPDPVLDPEGYERHVLAQAEQRMTMMRIEQTFAETHDADPKGFEAAYVELQKLDHRNPVDRAIGNRIYTSPNPGKALLRWHRETSAVREIGGDLTAYRQKMREELVNDPDMVKAVLARVREQGEGGAPGAPRNVTRLPPSLNRARGGSPVTEQLSAADGTDQAVFDYAMSNG